MRHFLSNITREYTEQFRNGDIFGALQGLCKMADELALTRKNARQADAVYEYLFDLAGQAENMQLKICFQEMALNRMSHLAVRTDPSNIDIHKRWYDFSAQIKDPAKLIAARKTAIYNLVSSAGKAPHNASAACEMAFNLAGQMAPENAGQFKTILNDIGEAARTGVPSTACYFENLFRLADHATDIQFKFDWQTAVLGIMQTRAIQKKMRPALPGELKSAIALCDKGAELAGRLDFPSSREKIIWGEDSFRTSFLESGATLRGLWLLGVAPQQAPLQNLILQ